MIYIAHAIIYCAELLLGCWLLRAGYPIAGAWVIVLTLLCGGIPSQIKKAKK